MIQLGVAEWLSVSSAGIFHVFHITVFFRLNLAFLGNQMPSQKELLEYKNVHMTFMWPRTTHSKFEAQEFFFFFFFCMGYKNGRESKKSGWT